MNGQALNALASAVSQHAAVDNSVGTAIPELHLSCFTSPTKLTSLVYEPCLCIIAQGSKEVILAEDSFRLDPAQFLLVSVDLPVDARILEASADKPYLGLRIALDSKIVGDLLSDGADISSGNSSERGLAVTPIELNSSAAAFTDQMACTSGSCCTDTRAGI